MSYAPDNDLGGFVKNIAKDVVSDLVSIPKEAARQAVGLPGGNLNHGIEGRSEVIYQNEGTREEDKGQNIQGVDQDERIVQEKESGENDKVERKLVYQDISGDEVAKEQRGEPAKMKGLVQNQVAVQVNDEQNVIRENLGKVRNIEEEGNNIEVGQMYDQDKDVVREWLYKAVWQGYGSE